MLNHLRQNQSNQLKDQVQLIVKRRLSFMHFTRLIPFWILLKKILRLKSKPKNPNMTRIKMMIMKMIKKNKTKMNRIKNKTKRIRTRIRMNKIKKNRTKMNRIKNKTRMKMMRMIIEEI